MSNEIKCEIIREIGVLSTSNSGWDTVLSLVAWNDNEPKYDLRDWNPDRSRCGKGKTFSLDEIFELKKILDEELSV